MVSHTETSRRSFLTIAGAAGVATTVFPFRNLQKAYAFGEPHAQEKAPYNVVKRVPQVCARACEADCAYTVVVGVDPVTGLERGLTLEGRPEDPVSNGKFCIKGLGFVDSMYDPDRLLVSLKRTNPKKGLDSDPGWITIKSTDAVAEIIAGMKKVKPAEILFASPGDAFTNRLCRSVGATRADQRTECFGTHYYINALAITNPPNKYYSSTYTPSHHLPGYDYENSKYQVWFGYDSFTKAGKAGQLNHWARAKRNGVKVVMFNPIRTSMADAFATEHHAIKPGTDLAVLLAMLQVIVGGRKYNEDAVIRYSDGPALVDLATGMTLKGADGGWLAWCTTHKAAEPIDTCHAPALTGGPYRLTVGGKTIRARPVLALLADAVAEYTPEWAARISDVPATDIRRIALEFAAAAPLAFIPSNKRDAASANFANGWRARHAISVLNTLNGSIDHEGGHLLLHGVKIPWLEDIAPPVAAYPPQPAEPVDFRNQFPVTNNIYQKRDYSAPGHYGMVAYGLYHTDRAKIVFFKNPYRGLFSTVQSQMLEAALEKMQLVADWNLYLDDLGYFCDYVIAAPHQYEEAKLDIRSYNPKNPCLVGGLPVQKTPGDALGWGAVAGAIGFALAPKYWTTDGSGAPDKKIPTNMNDPALKAAGAADNMTEFMAKGGFWIDRKPYENYKTIREIGYGRPNGRVRMSIDEFIEAGFPSLPKFSPRWSSPSGNYRFSLIITRAPWYMHADPNFVNNPVLKQINNRNYMDCVWLHPDAGTELGIKEGDEVIIENDPAYMKELPRPQKAKVHLSKRVLRKDCVLMFHGLGHRAKNLRVARDYGYRDGDLIPQKDPETMKKHDATGMGWVEDVYLSIRKA